MLTLPVIVGVGSSGSQVVCPGLAPGFVSGVVYFNVVIPPDSPTGVLPLTLVVGRCLQHAERDDRNEVRPTYSTRSPGR